MVKEKLQRRTDARAGRLLGDIFPFPLGVDEIPVGFEVFRIDQIGIEIKARRSRIGEVNEHMLLFGIVVAVLAAVPLGLIKNFGKYQRRLERTEDLSLVKDFEIRHRPAAVKIRQHVAGARFGDDARAQ